MRRLFATGFVFLLLLSTVQAEQRFTKEEIDAERTKNLERLKTSLLEENVQLWAGKDVHALSRDYREDVTEVLDDAMKSKNEEIVVKAIRYARSFWESKYTKNAKKLLKSENSFGEVLGCRVLARIRKGLR